MSITVYLKSGSYRGAGIRFSVIDEIPEIGESYDGETVTAVKDITDRRDPEQTSDDVYAYDLYDIVTVDGDRDESHHFAAFQARQFDYVLDQPKKWYAVQMDNSDDWDNGSFDFDEAKEMLKHQGRGLIAVIVNEDYCDEEITFDDLFNLDDLSDEDLADIVAGADDWTAVLDEMKILCDRAGKKLREMAGAGADCADHFAALRKSAPAEFLADTPDVSDEKPDLIDWLRDGAEQADMVMLAYAVQDILNIDLGI